MAQDAYQREAVAAPSKGTTPQGLPVGPAIEPLIATGLVVTKANLVKALRIYVPQLVDITSLNDERFLLSLTPLTPEGNK
ncbi:MAG: hypothetical protein M1136_01905 [Chloroflexi bacterium]|nr:hypothetical protein [Chloroflexota bacterium]MCL5074394.1 hypothetical protein [Chloroflexota bacterium]